MSKLAKALTAAAGNAGGANLYVEDVFSTYLYDGSGTQKYVQNGINLGNDPIGDVYLSGDNKTGYGVSGYTISTTGTVNIDTAVKHTGTGSYEFIGGTNNFLSWTDSTGLGSADFTIEFFARNINQNGAGTFSIGSTAGQDYAGLTIAAYQNGGVFISTSGTSWDYFNIVALNFAGIDNAWHHYAITRSGDTVRSFKDGVLQNSATMSGSIANKSGLVTLGKKSDSTTSIEGNIDEFRIVKGTALYVNNFTPPEQFHDFTANGKGGMVWIKGRDTSYDHRLFDTNRGAGKLLSSNNTGAEQTLTEQLEAFNFDGFQVGSNLGINASGSKNASWTFRKAEKFFDVVTYTGTGAVQNIAHNLGVAPACIIVKSTTNAQNWYVYHESLGNTQRLLLDSTVSAATSSSYWNNTSPTDSVFTVGIQANVNTSGATYVAYLFASDAGGFGDDGSESIIKCGSWDATGNNEVNLGFEPQWILIKNADGGNNWGIFDSMRGWTADGNMQVLAPNLSSAESSESGVIKLTSTGFTWIPAVGGGNTYIYIAIRRPMKTPESGTEVFALQTQTASGSDYVMADSSGFPIDWLITRRPSITSDWFTTNRLTKNYLIPNTTAAQGTYSYGFDLMEGVSAVWNANLTNSFAFKRATGFFDVVAYTGTGVARNVAHNLGVVPELLIFKTRSASVGWAVSCGEVGYTNGSRLEQSSQFYSEPNRVTGTPTSTTVPIGTDAYVNVNGRTYIAYLFASVAGVSKVGSYTGTGADLNVDCGFSAGARFILIKRTDSTGDWYVYDSVRGIVAGNDPYLLLNSTAAEVTSTDYIDPLSSGFTVTSTAPAALNASGGSYLFLAIA